MWLDQSAVIVPVQCISSIVLRRFHPAPSHVRISSHETVATEKRPWPCTWKSADFHPCSRILLWAILHKLPCGDHRMLRRVHPAISGSVMPFFIWLKDFAIINAHPCCSMHLVLQLRSAAHPAVAMKDSSPSLIDSLLDIPACLGAGPYLGVNVSLIISLVSRVCTYLCTFDVALWCKPMSFLPVPGTI